MRIVSWCNGSTTGFGSVCQGSNPYETTIEKTVSRCIFDTVFFITYAYRVLFSLYICISITNTKNDRQTNMSGITCKC